MKLTFLILILLLVSPGLGLGSDWLVTTTQVNSLKNVTRLDFAKPHPDVGIWYVRLYVGGDQLLLNEQYTDKKEASRLYTYIANGLMNDDKVIDLRKLK